MPQADERLEWRVRLGSAHPQKRLVVGAIALGAGFIGLQMGGPLLGLVGLLAVLVSTAELFLPLSYRLDAEGARVKCGISVTAISWPDVKRLVDMPDGVRLSPLPRPSRLDEFRGVYLRFANNAAEVSGKIRQFWNGDTGALDRGLDRAGDGTALGDAGGADPEAEA
jgi:hypothetical protein